jgi:2-dehydropantoate 2-reductase
MEYVVVGAGAIGGTIGARLARDGHDVLLCDADPEHVAAINDRGLTIEGPVEQFTTRVPAVSANELPDGLGAVLLAVKAQHTGDALAAIAPRLAPDGFVVSLQNGVNEPLIAAEIGEARTVGAFVNFGADYLEPGLVHYGGRGAVVVGEIDGRMTARVAAIRVAWLDFDSGAIATPNIWGYLWGKEAYGAMLFATALTNESIADALAIPAHRPLYIALAREMLAVAAARGVTPEPFDGFDPLAYLPDAAPGAAERSLDALVAHNRRSAKTHSGVWRDLAVRKRPTEVDAQLGIAVRLAAEAGVATPLTARLVALVHDIERGNRPQSLDTLAELAATMS